MITLRPPRSLTITMDAFGVDGFAVRLKICFSAESIILDNIAPYHCNNAISGVSVKGLSTVDRNTTALTNAGAA